MTERLRLVITSAALCLAGMAATAQPTREAVIADFDFGVDLCLDVVRSKSTAALNDLPTITIQGIGRELVKYILPNRAAHVTVSLPRDGAKDVYVCNVESPEEQDNLLRLTLGRWAKTKTAKITEGRRVTVHPAESSAGAFGSMWCEDSNPIVSVIGSTNYGRDVRVYLRSGEIFTIPYLEPNAPNPCRQE